MVALEPGLLELGVVDDWPEEPACAPVLPLDPLPLPVCALRLRASKSTGATIHTFFMLYS